MNHCQLAVAQSRFCRKKKPLFNGSIKCVKPYGLVSLRKAHERINIRNWTSIKAAASTPPVFVCTDCHLACTWGPETRLFRDATAVVRSSPNGPWNQTWHGRWPCWFAALQLHWFAVSHFGTHFPISTAYLWCCGIEKLARDRCRGVKSSKLS